MHIDMTTNAQTNGMYTSFSFIMNYIQFDKSRVERLVCLQVLGINNVLSCFILSIR